jgi:hypothetical protein
LYLRKMLALQGGAAGVENRYFAGFLALPLAMPD